MNKITTTTSIYYLTDDELQRFHLHSAEEIISVEPPKEQKINWLLEGF